jgi:hypothetical protein
MGCGGREVPNPRLSYVSQGWWSGGNPSWDVLEEHQGRNTYPLHFCIPACTVASLGARKELGFIQTPPVCCQFVCLRGSVCVVGESWKEKREHR